MIDLNKNTKRGKNYITSYFGASCFSVSDFYKSSSYYKTKAETIIKEKMRKNGFIDYKVLGGNSSFFTVGYTDKAQNTIYIETAQNTYKINLK